MEFKELLITYWSQVTLLLLAIASLIFYFIKRHFDNKSKKIEINHSIYQQNRLSAVNRFFENYAKAELMWNHIAIYDILSRKMSPKEIDQIIFPPLNDLKKNLWELKIYFEDSDYMNYKLIVDNVESINGKLSELYFDYNSQITDTTKSNDFYLTRRKILNENNKILSNLCNVLKETFRS